MTIEELEGRKRTVSRRGVWAGQGGGAPGGLLRRLQACNLPWWCRPAQYHAPPTILLSRPVPPAGD